MIHDLISLAILAWLVTGHAGWIYRIRQDIRMRVQTKFWIIFIAMFYAWIFGPFVWIIILNDNAGNKIEKLMVP